MGMQRILGLVGGKKAFLAAIALPLACSSDRNVEQVSQTAAPPTAIQTRILGFEGTIGGSNADWQALSGTATSSTTRSEGQKSLSLSNSTSATARSAALSTLGPLVHRE